MTKFETAPDGGAAETVQDGGAAETVQDGGAAATVEDAGATGITDTDSGATGTADGGATSAADDSDVAAETGDAAGTDTGDELDDPLVAEGEIAGDYLEELLDLLDFDGDIDLDVEGDRAVVSIDGGTDLTKLVGRKGEVLDALQELTRLAVHQKTGERSRLMLDIAQWRQRRREELTALGDKVARRVLETGEREELTPMTPFERKIVHDAVAAVSGVHSESEGVEPSRRVVVLVD